MLDVDGKSINALHPTIIGRLVYTGLKGLRLGSSLTYNRAFQIDGLGIDILLWEVHSVFRYQDFIASSEFGYINYGNHEVLKAALGYYVDIGYNLGGLLSLEEMEIIPFIRFNDYNNSFSADTEKGGEDIESENRKQRLDVGIHLKPIAQISFKLNYGYAMQFDSKKNATHIDAAVGYRF